MPESYHDGYETGFRMGIEACKKQIECSVEKEIKEPTLYKWAIGSISKILGPYSTNKGCLQVSLPSYVIKQLQHDKPLTVIVKWEMK